MTHRGDPTAKRIERLIDNVGRRVMKRCDDAARFTDREGGIERTFCCASMRRLHGTLSEWMAGAGVTCRVDSAGNFYCRRAGNGRTGKTLLVGSHLDTVPNAGRYDGVLGVMLGLAVVELADATGTDLPFDLEAVGFSDEEGIRYGVPFLGSRAAVGTLDDDLLSRSDARGVAMRTALDDFGCDATSIGDAILDPQRYLGFLEAHIEQGPTLEAEKLALGVVEAIVGQTRAGVRFRGEAGHAGTVPMRLRRDAMAAAAEWIVEVERIAKGIEGLVATVGRVDVVPNATNVIAGEVNLSMDVRHVDGAIRASAMERLVAAGHEIAERRSVEYAVDWSEGQEAVKTDAALTELLAECVCGEQGSEPLMTSGAGHDSMIVASRMPVALLFIRCAGGISHHPDESVTGDDVISALRAMWNFIVRLAARESDDDAATTGGKPTVKQGAMGELD